MAVDIVAKPADKDAALDFLRSRLPFRELDPERLQELAGQFTVDFFPKDTLVIEQEVTEVEHLYLIHRGGVKVFLTDADGAVTLKDFRGEGGYFGALSIIAGSKANLSVATVEDTFCFLLDKNAFLALVQSNPRVSQFYLKRFSEDLVNRAYAELRSRKCKTSPQQDAFYLFSVRVSDVVKRPAEVVEGSETIQNAAARMTRLGIGSLLVRDQSGTSSG